MDEPDTFSVEMQSDANDVLTVVLDGELDMADADWVEESLAAAAPHHRRMVIELDKLTSSTRPAFAHSSRSANGPTLPTSLSSSAIPPKRCHARSRQPA